MYLSRIKINNCKRKSAKFFNSRQVMHATIEGCFDDEDMSRKLWRLDYLKGQPYILILSENKPNFTDFVQQFGYDGDIGESKKYDKLLDNLSDGQYYRFRFCGNPVHKKDKLYSHVTIECQEKWLHKKSQKSGFSLENFIVTESNKKTFLRQKKMVTINTVVFEGILKITDTELFKKSLINGIGRGKAYGCGLMTLAGYN